MLALCAVSMVVRALDYRICNTSHGSFRLDLNGKSKQFGVLPATEQSCPAGFQCGMDVLNCPAAVARNEPSPDLGDCVTHNILGAEDRRQTINDLMLNQKDAVSRFKDAMIVQSGKSLGICVPCMRMGMYCPAGTVAATYTTRENLCPEGKFCERPDQSTNCSAGHACPVGTFKLLMDTKFLTCDKRAKGLFCPENTAVQMEVNLHKYVCPAGRYCPSSNESFPCPKGSYCMAMSLTPRKCSRFAHCPKGSSSSAIEWSGLVATAFFLLLWFGGGATALVFNRIYLLQKDTKDWLLRNKRLQTRLDYPELDAPSSPSQSLQKQFSGFDEKQEKMSFEFDNLGLVVHTTNGDKTVLEGVSGYIRHSTLVAVMGPSGAGKTTFMNTLCGRAFYGEVTGSIKINGRHDSIMRHRASVGFVPQDDVVHEDLTVEENLRYSALLRLAHGTSPRKYTAIVEDTLNLLQIERIRNSIVGNVEKRGISGGQRKRVNIGLEMCAEPTVLFLDEPTSGLDSTSSEVVLSALKDLTKLGVTIITVIHQPRYSIFTRFDQVLLLGVGGRTVYSGRATSALSYFSNLGFQCPSTENPADFFMDCISGEKPRYESADSTTTIPFKPSDLFTMWEENQANETQTSSDDSGGEEEKEQGVETAMPTFKPNEINLLSDMFRSFDPENKGLNSSRTLQLVADLQAHDQRSTGQRTASTLEIFQKQAGILNNTRSIFSFIKQELSAKNLFRREKVSSANQNIRQQEVLTNRQIEVLVEWLQQAHETPQIPMVDDESGKALPAPSTKIHAEDFVSFLLSHRTAHHPRLSQSKSTQRTELSSQRSWEIGLVPPVTVRKTPVFKQQLVVFTRRALQKAVRAQRAVLVDVLMLVTAAAAMAAINGREFSYSAVANDMMLVMLFFGCLSVVGSLKVFGSERLIFWRESSSGVNTLAFFVSQNIQDLPVILMKPTVYVWVYYALAMPPISSESAFIGIMMGLSWSCSGYGYVLSIILPPKNATLTAVIFSIMMGAFMSGIKPPMKGSSLRYFSFSYFALEAVALSIFNNVPQHISDLAYNRIASRFGWGECMDNGCTLSYEHPTASQLPAQRYGHAYMTPVAYLFAQGLVLRCIAAFLLHWSNREQQTRPTLSVSIRTAAEGCCSGCSRTTFVAQPGEIQLQNVDDNASNTTVTLPANPCTIRLDDL